MGKIQNTQYIKH